MENPKRIPPLSPRTREALEEELKKSHYQNLPEEEAHFLAAKALAGQENLGHVIFDRTNPADRLLLELIHME
jgi:hypothetical protein